MNTVSNTTNNINRTRNNVDRLSNPTRSNRNALKRNNADNSLEWKCVCKKKNTTKFCESCGLPKPACAKCGVDLKGAKFCGECGAACDGSGASVTSTATCAKCQAELNGEKFCGECGTAAS